MKIITGSKKGMNLYTLEGNTTRPTSQRVKEAVFSMIQGDIESRSVLELFGGCGQLSLECISRGAASAVICEKDKAACEIIRKNVRKTGFDHAVTLIQGDAVSFLERYTGEPFDLIFIDPPYQSDLLLKVMPLLSKVIKPTTLLIMETGEPLPDALCDGFERIKESRYSVSFVTILCPKKKESACMLPGSYDPISYGHLDLIRRACKEYGKVFVAVLNNPDKKYLFSREQRFELVKAAVKEFGDQVTVLTSDGLNVDLCREYGVYLLVKGIRNETDRLYEEKIAAFNASLLPGLQTRFLIADPSLKEVSSTRIREAISRGEDTSDLMPSAVANLAAEFIKST